MLGRSNTSRASSRPRRCSNARSASIGPHGKQRERLPRRHRREPRRARRSRAHAAAQRAQRRACSDSARASARRARRAQRGRVESVTLLIGGRASARCASARCSAAKRSARSPGATSAVMPLASMQRLLGEPGRVTRILVQSAPGTRRKCRSASCSRLAGPAPDRRRGRTGHRRCSSRRCGPSAQASALFAIIGALLGFLLAFNAILLDGARAPPGDRRPAPLRHAAQRDRAARRFPGAVPRPRRQRRRARRRLCALALGLSPIHRLSRGGVRAERRHRRQRAQRHRRRGSAASLVTCLASALPLLDLRSGLPRDAIYLQRGAAGKRARGAARSGGCSRSRWRCWRWRACCTRRALGARWRRASRSRSRPCSPCRVAFAGVLGGGACAQRARAAAADAGDRARRRARRRRFARSRWRRPAPSRCSAASRSAARARTCSPGSAASRTPTPRTRRSGSLNRAITRRPGASTCPLARRARRRRGRRRRSDGSPGSRTSRRRWTFRERS